MAEQTLPRGPATVPRTAFYIALGAWSLVVHAVLVTSLGAAIYGVSETAAYAAGFGLANLIVAGLAWRIGRWMLALAAVWAVLNLAFHLPFVLPGLRYPASLLDFGLAIPMMLALVAAAAAGGAGYARHRGWSGGPSPATERHALATVVAAALALVAVSGVLQVTSGASVSATERAGATEVAMRTLRFEPVMLTVDSGRTARLVIENRDLVVHTFTIDELGIDKGLLPGSEVLIEVPDVPAGTYTFRCAIAGHEDMRGTLIIR